MEEQDGRGGDAACWLPLVCPRCGELGGHRPGCPAADLVDAGSAGSPAPPPIADPHAGPGSDPLGEA